MSNYKNASAQMPTILSTSYLWEKVNDLRVKGMPTGLPLGIKSLDDICRLDRGRLATITGIPGSGKSEFVDFIATTFNRNLGMKTLFFSPENQPIAWHVNKLVQKFAGCNVPDLTKEELWDAVYYVSNNFFFFNYERITKLADIMSIAEEQVRTNGVSIIVIDSYNKIESDREASELETDFISKILDSLCRFAIEKNVLVILVAHPRKMERGRGGSYVMPNAYDINGSANFFNKSDYVIVVHREDRERDETTIRVDKVKFSFLGKGGCCTLRHDDESGNYYEDGVDDDGYPVMDDEDDHLPAPFVFPKVETPREPLDVEVSVYNGATDNIGSVVNLKEFLLTDRYKEVAERIRQGASVEERHSIKNEIKNSIPCATIAGTFSQRDNQHILSYSGLMSIDIDYKGNEQIMHKVPEILKKLDYITFFAKSISGDGFFAVCKIDYPERFKQHFFAIQQEFAGKGIVIDQSCKDITRLRFATYDADAYYNPNAHTYHLLLDDAPKDVKLLTHRETKLLTERASSLTGRSAEVKILKLLAEIQRKGLQVPDDYDTWFKLGMSLCTLGEKGRQLFHRISSLSRKYESGECDSQYDSIIEHYEDNNEFSIGTAIGILSDVIMNAKINK